jgi:hypothetical protein
LLANPDLTGFGHKFGRKSAGRLKIGLDKLILETCQVFQLLGGNLSYHNTIKAGWLKVTCDGQYKRFLVEDICF